jgi:hypothetical protein
MDAPVRKKIKMKFNEEGHGEMVWSNYSRIRPAWPCFRWLFIMNLLLDRSGQRSHNTECTNIGGRVGVFNRIGAFLT